MPCRSLLSRGTSQQIYLRMRAYNALNLQALGRGTVWGISKAVIVIRHAISNVVPWPSLEATPAASFWQRILRSPSRSSKPTLQKHTIMCSKKAKRVVFSSLVLVSTMPRSTTKRAHHSLVGNAQVEHIRWLCNT